MNFYEQRQDKQLYNKPFYLIYTADYVCFIYSEHDFECASIENNFSRANHIDYNAVKQLVAEDFAISGNDWKHHANFARHFISNILGNYFLISICKQKTRYSDNHLLPKYTK